MDDVHDDFILKGNARDTVANANAERWRATEDET
jgi:hypothetical protein